MRSEPMPEPAATPSYDVAAVARRLGVAPSTLRTWDRRYGIGPSSRTSGRHRRYSELDLARLEQMHDLTLQGVPTGEAARVALAAPVRAGMGLSPRGERAEPAANGTGDAAGRRAGRPGASARVHGLTRAALALDAAAVLQQVRASLRRRGVVWTWDRLLVPVLVGIGHRYETTGSCVEAEHLLSTVVLAAFSEVTGRMRRPHNVRPVLLACAEEEQHSLPVYALGAALATRRIASRNFGARTPHDALAAAIRRTGPLAVFVWSQLPPTADTASLARLPSLRPRSRLIVGGPGWDGRRLPSGVLRVSSLQESVALVAAAAGVGPQGDGAVTS
jgi:MerR family transcriptional regulator, light-induced transcriptional regulator